jgi:D-cysteine desulfhydrase
MAKFLIPDKLNLAQLPTPIHYLSKLSQFASKFGEVRIFVKRDDLTHGPAAGNKIRKLEFLLAEAIVKKKKVVFTCGGLQSNHARATALLCQQVGLESVLFLKGEKPAAGTTVDGNLLIDYLSGAQIKYVTDEQYENIAKTFFDAGEVYRKRDGTTPFLIPEGGSSDIGAMGYIAAVHEIASQLNSNGIPEKFSSIVVANGSGGTHAGLLLGRNLLGWDDHCQVVSFNVCRTAEQMTERVKSAAFGCVQRYRLPVSIMADDLQVVDGYVGAGYAQASPELFDFIVRVAREDGILLDPVYTAKALWGLVSELRASPEQMKRFGKNILFIHTGGFPSVFAHKQSLIEAMTRTTA